MNRHQVQVWIRGACIVAFFFMAVTLFFGAEQIGKVNTAPLVVHKVEHFFYYGTMAFLLAYGLGRRWWWIALFAVPLVGALDEWHQLYTPGRNASVYDWMVDAVGTALAVGVYWYANRWHDKKTGLRTKDLGLRTKD